MEQIFVTRNQRCQATLTHSAAIVFVVAMVMGALGTASAATVNFYTAFKNYQAGKFSEAHSQFSALAELGSGAAQFNLGAMAVRGEGQEKNQGAGVGWMLAAAENGYDQLSAARLAEFRSKLTPEQAAESEKILSRYGHRALQQRVLPGSMTMSCRQFRPAQREQYAEPLFPMSAASNNQDGVVLLEFTVGVDGLARDPHVLAELPAGIFDDATIDSALKSRFKPAIRNGQPVESRMSMHMTYYNEGGGALWQLKSVKRIREAADQKIPAAEYIVGLIGTLDRTLNIPEEKARAMLLSSAQAGTPPAQYWVSRQLVAEELCGNPNKMALWLTSAAKGGDAGAQVELVRNRLSGQLDDAAFVELKQFLTEASASDDPFALKHAAAIFAMSPHEPLRDKPSALAAAKKLSKHDRSMDPHIEEAMAAGYAANLEFKDAVKLQERAIQKAQKLYWNTNAMKQRLAAYQAKEPVYGDIFDVPAAETPPPPVRNELEDCSKKRRGCGREPDRKRIPTGSLIPE